ncbi:hypothetical protein [Porticoccus sp. Uisw_050_02]|uniref:hypothetical protein n=1 Tax=Porticoccus sp. Uisw_050_02 TaxID=3230978 RepID=UPI0039E80CD1
MPNSSFSFSFRINPYSFSTKSSSSYSSKFHHIDTFLHIWIERPSDTSYSETPNLSNLGIDTDTALPLHPYRQNNPWL